MKMMLQTRIQKHLPLSMNSGWNTSRSQFNGTPAIVAIEYDSKGFGK